MLQALVEGKATAQEMAELAKKQLRKKIPELALALEGKVESASSFRGSSLTKKSQRLGKPPCD